jgi:gamma-glutamyltranspeptidase/glutathione hydrolase
VETGVADARWTHLGIEAAKLAAADRDRVLGDPTTTGTSVDELLDDERIRRLAATIDPDRAARPPVATQPPGGGTVFVGAVDSDGMAVSLIQSVYYGFGSGIVDPETGILFHNRGTSFSLVPGHPNELAPGKRPLHTLLPAMLFRDDVPGPWLVVGSMGGDAQPQIHTQFVSAVVDGGVDIATAVAAPRWFVTAPERFTPPMNVLIESRVDRSVIRALEAMGHPVMPVEPFDSIVGQEHAIELVEGGPAAPGGTLRATTDPRSDGAPTTW